MSNALFSKVQQRVLGLLFVNPDRSFYTNEIVRLVGVGVGAVQRELEKLEAGGLAQVSRTGNQKHYQANRNTPIFEELRSIFIKTSGVADVLRPALIACGERIEVAFIYGSIASGTDKAGSDIDLMLIGEGLSYAAIYTALTPCEKHLSRPVNPSIYTKPEFQRKLMEGSGFLDKVMAQPKIFLLGSADELAFIGQALQDGQPQSRSGQLA